MRKYLNWGTGIIIVIILFLASLAIRLYIAFHREVNLVADDYYPKELIHQEIINKKKNALELRTQIEIRQKPDSLIIVFPDEFQKLKISGDVNLYRPSDPSLDRNFKIPADSYLRKTFPIKGLKKGKYIVQIDWSANNKSYYQEENLLIK